MLMQMSFLDFGEGGKVKRVRMRRPREMANATIQAHFQMLLDGCDEPDLPEDDRNLEEGDLVPQEVLELHPELAFLNSRDRVEFSENALIDLMWDVFASGQQDLLARSKATVRSAMLWIFGTDNPAEITIESTFHRCTRINSCGMHLDNKRMPWSFFNLCRIFGADPYELREKLIVDVIKHNTNRLVNKKTTGKNKTADWYNLDAA